MNKIICPQAEDGHTDIANEIMEALAKIRISGEAMQVLFFILRKTYGWHKKADYISLSQFTLGTGLKKVTICKAIKKLKDMNVIITKKGNTTHTNYCFNKHYDKWKPLPKKVILPKKETIVTKKGNNTAKSLPKKRHTKETNKTKETITKENHSVSSQKIGTNIDIKRFIDYFFNKHLEKTGHKYSVDGGKDGAIVKKLLYTYKLYELKEYCNLYFESDHKFILESGYSISMFKYNLPKLLTPKKSEIGGMDALQEFSRERKEKK